MAVDWRRSKLFDGLLTAEVESIVAEAQPVAITSGQIICRQGDPGASMFLVARGRLQVSVPAGRGTETVVNTLGPGDHFGELSLLAEGPRTANVTAVTDGELLELHRGQFEELILAMPRFAANVGKRMSGWVRRELSGRRRVHRPAVVALIRTTPTTGCILPEMLRALPANSGVTILTDRPQECTGTSPVQSLPSDFDTPARAEVCRRVASLVADGKQVVIDVRPEHLPVDLLKECNEVWWLTQPGQLQASDAALNGLINQAPDLARRIDLVWLIPPVAQHFTPEPAPAGIGGQPVRVCGATTGQARLRPAGVARLLHRLNGIHVGLALGGGAAWGAAHVGVLDVFEREGVFFDRVAGTSIGAVVAAAYAADYPATGMLDLFAKEMAPPRVFRMIPGGGRWYLLAQFRLGLLTRTMRRLFHDWTFEGLPIPAHAVAVDLVSGREVVGESGEVAPALLASTNLPGFGMPILRDGQALTDGGILNNLPVDVLRNRGANFVVAVDVAQAVTPRFVGNEPTTPLARMKRPSVGATLLRVLEVQISHLRSPQAASADVLIMPDVSAYPFDDFTTSDKLCAIGARTAEQLVGDLKRKLAELIAPAE